MSVLLLMPPQIQDLNQQGAIERAFHDALVPNLAYRSEAMAEEWPANTGVQIFQTRPGLITPKVQPLQPGQDPQPSQVIYEQWSATLQQFADAVDTHMPTAITSNANLFLRNIHQLGIGAGMSINRVARNALFQAYLSGNSVTLNQNLTTDTQITVSSVNGFTSVLQNGTRAQPLPVSPASPLTVTLGTGAGAVSLQVVGVALSNPADPVGPGTLFFSTQIGTVFPVRSAITSSAAVTIVRSGGGATVDAIGAADTLLLQDCINAVAILRNAYVMPHEDGFYHAHISPLANAQVFADPVFQRLNTALPEGVFYSQGFIGHMSGVMFFMNQEAPNKFNTGTRTFNGPNNAQYSPDIGAETTNDNGIDIGRVIITGKGALYERYLDESQYVTEAGTVGKIGTFDVVNNGISILTERIRLVLRAPIDRLQQIVGAAWSITTSFPVPSDALSPSGPQLYKRAVILEHAL